MIWYLFLIWCCRESTAQTCAAGAEYSLSGRGSPCSNEWSPVWELERCEDAMRSLKPQQEELALEDDDKYHSDPPCYFWVTGSGDSKAIWYNSYSSNVGNTHSDVRVACYKCQSDAPTRSLSTCYEYERAPNCGAGWNLDFTTLDDPVAKCQEAGVSVGADPLWPTWMIWIESIREFPEEKTQCNYWGEYYCEDYTTCFVFRDQAIHVGASRSNIPLSGFPPFI